MGSGHPKDLADGGRSARSSWRVCDLSAAAVRRRALVLGVEGDQKVTVPVSRVGRRLRHRDRLVAQIKADRQIPLSEDEVDVLEQPSRLMQSRS